MASHFDYICSIWYPNLTKKLKHRIETTQNKCMYFCLQLDKLKPQFPLGLEPAPFFSEGTTPFWEPLSF